MRLVTPLERVLIALGPSRNVFVLELDEPISSAAALAQVMAWVDAWPRFRVIFSAFGPWHRAHEASVDPARHVVTLDAGDTPLETLFVATLTGSLDPDIPPWQVILTNPADGDTRGPCRIIAHFDHLIADGVRFVNLLSATRTHDRQPAAFAAIAKRLPRLSLDAFLGAPRDARIVVPDVALLATPIRNHHTDEGGGSARPTRRLTRAITRAAAHVAEGHRLRHRCAAVTMIGRRPGSAANAVTAVEVNTAATGDPSPKQSPASALVGLFARQRWFMRAGQTFLSILPTRAARWLTAKMTGRWDGLLTLVPFGRRPLRFAGREIGAIWCLTVPVVALPLLLVTAAYRNRFHLAAVTAARWHGTAKAFAAALDDELNRPAP